MTWGRIPTKIRGPEPAYRISISGLPPRSHDHDETPPRSPRGPLVLEWTDAGIRGVGHPAEHTTLGSNRPLRGWKGDLYEGGIRVPCFVHGPGRLPSGVVLETPTHVVDWLPTLIQAASGDPQRLEAAEGIDLWAALRGEASDLPERTMYWDSNSIYYKLYIL